MKSPSRTLQPEELEQLFGQLKDPYRATAQVAYLTGVRSREVLLLKTEQLTNQQILFDGANNKFGKSFAISMTDALAEIFGRIRPSSGYVFSLNSGKDAISVDSFSRQLRRAAGSLGLKNVSVHSFRGTHIAHMSPHS